MRSPCSVATSFATAASSRSRGSDGEVAGTELRHCLDNVRAVEITVGTLARRLGHQQAGMARRTVEKSNLSRRLMTTKRIRRAVTGSLERVPQEGSQPVRATLVCKTAETSIRIRRGRV